MTFEETEMLLRYLLQLYPNVKMTEQQIKSNVVVWAREFKNDSKEDVASAVKIARIESPDWMPSIPKLQHALRMNALTIKRKSKDQEFKDTHCGKSFTEWSELCGWEASTDGSIKLKSYKKRLQQLVGVNHETERDSHNDKK